MRCCTAIECFNMSKEGFKTRKTHHGRCGVRKLLLNLAEHELRPYAKLPQFKRLLEGKGTVFQLAQCVWAGNKRELASTP